MSKNFYAHHEFAKLSVQSNAKTVNNLLTSTTLGSSGSNSHFFLGSTTGRTISLPAAGSASGISYEFTVAATAASHLIAAPAASIVGSLSSDVTTAGAVQSTGAAKTSLQTTSGSAVGDNFRLTSNGTTWFLSGQTSAFNGVKFN